MELETNWSFITLQDALQVVEKISRIGKYGVN